MRSEASTTVSARRNHDEHRTAVNLISLCEYAAVRDVHYALRDIYLVIRSAPHALRTVRHAPRSEYYVLRSVTYNMYFSACFTGNLTCQNPEYARVYKFTISSIYSVLALGSVAHPTPLVVHRASCHIRSISHNARRSRNLSR